ncbi:hypothetical protein EA658_16530 [Pseudoxanthomonas winnipegensis]|uniref:Uncharacterized protein n=1 Tax=Pseudoxanthomonas winnipegensis TaxID=2480810 RepID=A0ABY1WCF8_9GAMM|nr:hypothetical protein [Pseudoxanthomonas winnipegensis]TAA11269.1 hypothetical protein EA659_07945 [Pseudoxanthomonas winnipegensis]TAA18692.1 hypothetical protein EA658_16530 [Pseudoxanthomonas winnipegensis]TAH73932.1 hypothetical protein EA657_00215 [Pseudoxanthomonas winnipegensis]
MPLDTAALKSLALELAAAMPPTPESAIDYPAVDVSPRGRKMASIIRIADQHGWHSAITHFLQTKGVPYLSDLSDVQLDDLADRMEGFIDAAETGSSLPDCLPAC